MSGRLTVHGEEVDFTGPRQVETSDTSAMDSDWTIPASATMTAIAGLTKTITLTEPRTVMAYYSVSWSEWDETFNWRNLNTWFNIDGTDDADTRSVTGIHQASTQAFGTNSALWVGTLAAGSHTFKVQYYSDYPIVFLQDGSTGHTRHGRTMSIVVL